MNKTTDPAPDKQKIGDLSVFQIRGQDGLSFFNNQTLTDLSKHPNGTLYTAICTPTGRILFIRIIQRRSDDMLVVVDGSLGDNFLQYVTMRRFRMDFAIEKAPFWVKVVPPQQNPTIDTNIQLVESAEAGDGIDEFWHLMFQIGLPWITADTSEAYIPQHVNLAQMKVIDFDKGCYPGQEIVARLHFLGRVKKQMRLLEYTGDTELPLAALQEKSDMAGLETLCSPALPTKNGWICQAIFKSD